MRIAGTAEKAKPRTGTKSNTPASTASSSAEGTCSSESAMNTTSPANTDVATFPTM
jgi:hypothetical protein